MLTQTGCLVRRKRLWASLPADVTWILVADPRHVQYLCNFWVQPLSPSGGERGWLCLERDGRATLLADNFARDSAVHSPWVDREIVEQWYDHVHTPALRQGALLAALARIRHELIGRVGMVERNVLPVAAAELLELPTGKRETTAPLFNDLGIALTASRRCKESDEVTLLRQCIQAGAAGMARARELIRPGVTELEVYRAVTDACTADAGRPGLVYGDFRVSNAERYEPGGLPAGHTINDGELFILDFSFVLDGYRGDFTNTFAAGKVSPDLRTMHALCVAGLASGEGALVAGTPARVIYAAVQKPFRDARRVELFPHHAGHGIGLWHPEAPYFVPESTDILQVGDVVTLEPGAYAKAIGGMRIERNYLITPSGFDLLSGHDIALA